MRQSTCIKNKYQHREQEPDVPVGCADNNPLVFTKAYAEGVCVDVPAWVVVYLRAEFGVTHGGPPRRLIDVKRNEVAGR